MLFRSPDTTKKYNEKIKGLIAGSKKVVLGTSTFITTNNYYDHNYRLIQTISDLYVGSNGREVTSTKYDFIGNPLQVRQKHIFQGSDSTMINTYYAYDNYGRLLTTEHQLNDGPRLLLSENFHNETGQLQGKGVHKQDTNFLQDIDYDYNIRGWLTAINNPNNLDDDLFSMRLFYNDISALSPLTSQAQYNGNISGVYWNRQTNGSSDTLKSSYSYLYDELNRINNSYYGEDTTGSGLIALPQFREYDYSYDLNGNILGLKRTGSAGTAIDNLAYDYGQTPGYSNNLVKVTDSSQSASGFKDGTNQSEDYEYDKNGNLKKDLNKGITTITYNFLNLPELITMTGGNIRYYYDATGRKLSKVVTEGANTTVRSYEGGFEYENGLLSIIHTDEGFVDNTTTGFVYNYFLKDHLGNTRAVFSPGTGGALTLNQSSDYYTFGLNHEPGYGAGYSKYKYNGKEIQDDLIGGVALDWYDYGARFYDPAIGRWHVPDPLAELFFNQNPYHYVSNNPLLFIDPTGMAQVETPYGKMEGKLIYWDGYGSDESEIGEKKKEQDDPPKKGEKRKTDSELWAMAGEFYAGAYSITGGGYAAAMDGRDPFNPTQADENEAGDALFKAVLFIGGEYVASKAFTLLKHFMKAVRSSSYATKTSSNVLLNTSRQLQAKFKHAGDFGVVGNYSKANAGKFGSAINQHINSAGVQTINGTYKGQSVIHYLNPNTGLNVISSPSGQFISGWKLNPAQLQNVLKHGGL